jgi:hypothetical protein
MPPFSALISLWQEIKNTVRMESINIDFTFILIRFKKAANH